MNEPETTISIFGRTETVQSIRVIDMRWRTHTIADGLVAHIIERKLEMLIFETVQIDEPGRCWVETRQHWREVPSIEAPPTDCPGKEA